MFPPLQDIHILSILADDNADLLAMSLLILYCNFLSLILSSIVMISLYILSKRLRLKCKELSDVRVVSVTRKDYGFVAHFCKDL